MAKKLGFTIERLEAMGLTKNADGTYSKKKVESITDLRNHSLIGNEETIVVKQKVNDSPDFEHKINTEWFITYNVPSKKNSRINFVRNGKQISLPSANHKKYKDVTKMQYNIFGIEFRNAIEHYGLKPPFKVEFTFVRGSKHRFDYCNAAQTCEDLFTENNWIEDDSADFLIPSFKPYQYDKNNPGVHIKLLK
jgi:hypothetical protein